MPLSIKVGARGSKLSQAQVWEVHKELQAFHPDIEFTPEWITTNGDTDLKTSLRLLDKSDFFTKEIDALQLQGSVRIAIHAAKDLPEPLPEGLRIVALTRGVDSSDALVYNVDPLPHGAVIGSSSLRREKNLLKWRSDLKCIDIRGNILERLALLDEGKVDGVVIAEAALIRLNLTHRKRISLEGETAALQGQLAIIARDDDYEMARLFSCLDVRRTLYLGTHPPAGHFIHYPVIKLIPRPIPPHILDHMRAYTHLIFTSKNAVTIFFNSVGNIDLNGKSVVAIGRSTASRLETYGYRAAYVAEEESQEGIINLMRPMNLDQAYILLPRSALARPLLEDFLVERKVQLQVFDLYDTVSQKIEPVPDIEQIDEIIFTSPSTVRAFVEIFSRIPDNKKLTCIGPITKQELLRSFP